MNSPQIFDLLGSISTCLSLPFKYGILFVFLKKTLGYSKRLWMFVSFCLIVSASEYLVIIFHLPLYQQILIDNTFWFCAILVLFNSNITAKLYAFVIQAATALLISISFIGLDYTVSPLLLRHLNMVYPVDVFLLLLIDILREILNLAVLYLELKIISKQINFCGKQLEWYQGIYLLLPDFSIYGLSVIFYLVQELKINHREYSLYSIFPSIYYFLPLISLSLLATMAVTAFTFRKMVENAEIKKNDLLMQQQFKQQLNHQKNLETFYKGLRGIRHDIKNHLVCLQHLAENGDMQEIRKYLVNIEGAIAELGSPINTGNPVSDAVITEKMNLAKMNGVQFEQDVMLRENIIEPMDLCVLLSNTLDNAIEACNKITDSSISKAISINSCMKGAYLIIEISNSASTKLQYNSQGIVSSKIDCQNHGIGFSNIQSTVNKYNGIIDIVEEKNTFTINMMLKVMT